ncbi:MAG: hypothetical protein VW257_04615 [Quisquiliibacterium sp.]
MVETLHKQGRITDNQADSFARFRADMERANRHRPITGAYGERIAGRAVESDRCPETLKEQAHQRALAALEAVEQPELCGVLRMLVCEDINSLREVGQRMLGYRAAPAAQAAACQAVQNATFRLWQHYREVGVM